MHLQQFKENIYIYSLLTYNIMGSGMSPSSFEARTWVSLNVMALKSLKPLWNDAALEFDIYRVDVLVVVVVVVAVCWLFC